MDNVVSVVRDLAYVQLDTFHTVVPPQIIALASRVDNFRSKQLEDLLWREKTLFEPGSDPSGYGLTEDYPLYLSIARGYPPRQPTWWGRRRDRAQGWLDTHEELVRSILGQLEGAELTLNEFGEHVPSGRKIDGWFSGSEVAITLVHLQSMGEVMVVRREGNQKVWGLPGDFLPAWVDRSELPFSEVEKLAAQRALRALGQASPGEINYYFPRGKYLNLRGALTALEAEGKVHRVRVEGLHGKEARYIHEEDLALLEGMDPSGADRPVHLLSPYDNLIAHRGRTNELFGFDYTHGNYLPPNKRKFGLYVLPILWGDQIIGRLDPELDRSTRQLRVNSVHAEPNAPSGLKVAEGIAATVDRLASLVHADEVVYGSNVPRFWKAGLN